MKYEVYINYRDWEIIAEIFEFEKLNRGIYDQKKRLGFTRESWDGVIPIYLNDYSTFNSDYLKEISKNVVTPEPIFSIFDRENLNFSEMLDAIQEKIPGIVKPTPGDDNPFEGDWVNRDSN